jgi:hypothetical protein
MTQHRASGEPCPAGIAIQDFDVDLASGHFLERVMTSAERLPNQIPR